MQNSKPWLENYRLYTAREYEPELDLYYYRSRYYDAKIGKFTSRDLLLYVNGPNPYSYVNNNPVNYVDPWGLSSKGLFINSQFNQSEMFVGGVSQLKNNNHPTDCPPEGTLRTLIYFRDHLEKMQIKGADKFMHCVGSYCASQESPYMAEKWLDFREYTDYLRKGDSEQVREEDQRANRAGREGAINGQSLAESCKMFLTPEELIKYDKPITDENLQLGIKRKEFMQDYFSKNSLFSRYTINKLFEE